MFVPQANRNPSERRGALPPIGNKCEARPGVGGGVYVEKSTRHRHATSGLGVQSCQDRVTEYEPLLFP